jgi:hypothetical protein
MALPRLPFSAALSTYRFGDAAVLKREVSRAGNPRRGPIELCSSNEKEMLTCPAFPKHLTSPLIQTHDLCTKLYALQSGEPRVWMLDNGKWQLIRGLSNTEWEMLGVTAKRLEAVAA